MTRGNAISEYALPLLLIVVVIVATLTKTGLVDRLLGVFSGSVNDWSGGGQITSVAALGSPVLPLAAAQMPRLDSDRVQQVCFTGSNTCLNVSSNQDTTGGLGDDGVNALSDLLDAIRQKLIEKNAPQDTIDLVTQLANHGHLMADRMQIIEQVCPGAEPCTGASETLARDTAKTLKSDLNQFKSIHADLLKYLAKHPEALVDFPEAKPLINSKVKEIAKLVSGLYGSDIYSYRDLEPGKSVPKAVRDEIAKSGKSSARSQDDSRIYRKNQDNTWDVTSGPRQGTRFKNTAVKTVHQDSNVICSQGGGYCFRRLKGGEWLPVDPLI